MQNNLQERFTRLQTTLETHKRNKIIFETELKQVTEQQDLLEKEAMALTEAKDFPGVIVQQIAIEQKINELLDQAETELSKLI